MDKPPTFKTFEEFTKFMRSHEAGYSLKLSHKGHTLTVADMHVTGKDLMSVVNRLMSFAYREIEPN